VKEQNHHYEIKRPEDYLEILYRRHFQGALVRSCASVIMWVFALSAYLTNTIKMNHFAGVTLSVLYLILINPPTLLLLKRITHMRLYRYASLLINFLEILGYTAIIYFLGGIEATFLTLIYAALITYVGVVAPRRFPYIIAFLCSAAFSFVVAGEYFGLLPHQTVVPSFDPPILTRLTDLSVVIGLLLVVAYISSLTAGILKKNRNKLREQNVALMEKAASLEEAQKELRTAHQKLESRVEERTTELRGANDRLRREIRERERTEEALRESEQKYRLHFENVMDVVFSIDREFIVRTVSPSVERSLGYKPEEIIGQRLSDLNILSPQTLDQAMSNCVRIFAGETIDSSTYEFIAKDGTRKIGDVSGAPLFHDGKVTGLISVARDITERKRAEEALYESEVKYRTLFDESKEPLFITTTDGNFVDLNEATVQLFGYDNKEELMKIKVAQAYFNPEDRSKFQEIMARQNYVKDLEQELRRKDRSKIYALLTVTTRRDPEGNIIGYKGTIKDITERKRAEEALRQSEERYRTILESIEDGYYEVDLAGNFTFVNDSICRIWGYPEEELIGMNDRQYIHKETAERVYQVFNHVFKTGESGRCNHEVLRKDGTKKYVEVSISLKKDALGKPIGFRGITRDITDRKRIEERLFQAEKLRAVGEMASGVAHDFNNALAAIIGNTQLLLHTAQDEELKEPLKIIEQVAKDSSQTVRRLQDFTRKPVPQELFKVDINSIIRDSIEITKPKWKDEAQNRGIRIEIVTNLEDIPFASGNASELREVFTNMIFNAIEAMHEGGKVEIRTFKKRRDIFIQISDTGIGIAEEAKKRIFEPFFTTKPFTNTGLGLSMSYGIVKRFGGEIEVESKVGQGTTFTIILPIGEGGKEETVDPQPIKKGIKARILVIDDEEFIRSVLGRTLAQADHQVTLAEDGTKGVQLFKEGKFDLVLTDWGMPGMSGWEVCRMIKEVSPRTPVGMITGWGDERNRNKMEEYGLDFFISKPFDLAQILNVVAETMESKEG